jgi:hypothetical protein
MRERQLLYLQYTPHCSSRRKPAVSSNGLRQSVTHTTWKVIAPTEANGEDP